MESSIMQYLQFIVFFALILSLFLNVSNAKDTISSTITVDLSGNGNFASVQAAIDSIPSNNKLWTLIHVKAGIYKEKVQITRDKQFIVLQGDGSNVTSIQWGDGGDSGSSTTFQLYADNLVARDITFINTFNLMQVTNVTWAPAALIQGDKASFYHCGFVGLQDTLTDFEGRHYFESCYIEGAIDFIWGGGQSVYQDCTLNVTKSRLGEKGYAYITAQARESEANPNGFVFNHCTVLGTGLALLGRAYGNHSRVVFFKSYFENIIAPKGWDAWFSKGKEDTIMFSEVQNTGPGADMSKRVTWEKKLSQKKMDMLLNKNTFINQDEWIENQPSN